MSTTRWLCPKCHAWNSEYGVRCAFCGTQKPVAPPPPPPVEEAKK